VKLVELPSSGGAAIASGNRAVATLGSVPPRLRLQRLRGVAELVRRVDERALRELTPAERRSLARGS
jgi:hypothetical protein